MAKEQNHEKSGTEKIVSILGTQLTSSCIYKNLEENVKLLTKQGITKEEVFLDYANYIAYHLIRKSSSTEENKIRVRNLTLDLLGMLDINERLIEHKTLEQLKKEPLAGRKHELLFDAVYIKFYYNLLLILNKRERKVKALYNMVCYLNKAEKEQDDEILKQTKRGEVLNGTSIFKSVREEEEKEYTEKMNLNTKLGTTYREDINPKNISNYTLRAEVNRILKIYKKDLHKIKEILEVNNLAYEELLTLIIYDVNERLRLKSNVYILDENDRHIIKLLFIFGHEDLYKNVNLTKLESTIEPYLERLEKNYRYKSREFSVTEDLVLDAVYLAMDSIYDLGEEIEIYRDLDEYTDKEIKRLGLHIRRIYTECLFTSLICNMSILYKHNGYKPASVSKENEIDYYVFYINHLSEEYSKKYKCELTHELKEKIYKVVNMSNILLRETELSEECLERKVSTSFSLRGDAENSKFRFSDKDLEDLNILISDETLINSRTHLDFIGRALYLVGLSED